MHDVQLDAQTIINILQRKLNEAEQRATEYEALFLMLQNQMNDEKKEIETNEA